MSEVDLDIEIDALVNLWKKELLPSDVDVRWMWADLDEGYRAQCIPDIRNNRLLIKLAKADNLNMQWDFDVTHCWEETIIHELLHWRMKGCEPEADTMSYELWEAAIERTAQDFMRFKRRVTDALS